MIRARPWVSRAVLALALAFAPGPTAAASQQLPPDVQIDLYLVRADRHIENQNWAAALEALDIVVLLQADQGIETPTELWFTHATAALEAGYPQTAIASATTYLQEAGREGENYGAALALLDEAISRAEVAATPVPAPRDPVPARAAEPVRAAEPAPPAEPVRAAQPARAAEPARAAQPARAAEPVRAAEPAPAPAAQSEPAVEPAGGAGGLTVLFPLVAMNASTMAFTGSEPINASQRTGVGGGFGVAFPVSGQYGVQIGAQFAQKGARMTQGAGAADLTFESVDITALARISAATVANLPLYALVGPYASFELGCRFVPDPGSGAGPSAAAGDCRSASLNTQSTDFGLSAGLGIEMGTGETRITAGLLYSYGIQDINRVVGETARHRVLNIHVGVARAF